jgi:sec-independent protein translocase protein TatA
MPKNSKKNILKVYYTKTSFIWQFYIIDFYTFVRFNTNQLRHKLYIMGKLGLTEILLILGIILLLFGGKKIPELMKGLGTGIKEFKNAAKNEEASDKKDEEAK